MSNREREEKGSVKFSRQKIFFDRDKEVQTNRLRETSRERHTDREISKQSDRQTEPRVRVQKLGGGRRVSGKN